MREIKQIVISHKDPVTALAKAILEADEDTVIMVPSLFIHRLALRAARSVGKRVMVAVEHGKRTGMQTSSHHQDSVVRQQGPVLADRTRRQRSGQEEFV